MKRAFTLIELLVVIAIIAILAAILFPVFAQAKMAAKKSADLASVKQISLSSVMYSADVDDVAVCQNPNADNFPVPWNAGVGLPLGFMDPKATQNWAQSLQPYMKSLPLYVSVAAPKNTGIPNDPNNDWGYVNKPNAGNSTWFYNGTVQQKSLTSISAPAEFIVFQSAGTTTRESRVQPALLNPAMVCNGIDLFEAGSTFGKGANYGWADGHAGYKLRTAVKYRNLGVSGKVNAQGPGLANNGVPNTTGLSDPATNYENRWQTWGDVCDVSAL